MESAPKSFSFVVKPDSVQMETVGQKVGEVIDEEWENFKKKYNKNYATKEEECKRKQLFVETYQAVKQRNRQTGNSSGKVLVNEFADWTPEEMKVLCGLKWSYYRPGS